MDVQGQHDIAWYCIGGGGGDKITRAFRMLTQHQNFQLTFYGENVYCSIEQVITLR